MKKGLVILSSIMAMSSFAMEGSFGVKLGVGANVSEVKDNYNYTYNETEYSYENFKTVSKPRIELEADYTRALYKIKEDVTFDLSAGINIGSSFSKSEYGLTDSKKKKYDVKADVYDVDLDVFVMPQVSMKNVVVNKLNVRQGVKLSIGDAMNFEKENRIEKGTNIKSTVVSKPTHKFNIKAGYNLGIDYKMFTTNIFLGSRTTFNKTYVNRTKKTLSYPKTEGLFMINMGVRF